MNVRVGRWRKISKLGISEVCPLLVEFVLRAGLLCPFSFFVPFISRRRLVYRWPRCREKSPSSETDYDRPFRFNDRGWSNIPRSFTVQTRITSSDDLAVSDLSFYRAIVVPVRQSTTRPSDLEWRKSTSNAQPPSLLPWKRLIPPNGYHF